MPSTYEIKRLNKEIKKKALKEKFPKKVVKTIEKPIKVLDSSGNVIKIIN